MKNILGKTESLTLYNKERKRVYAFTTLSNGYSGESTYDSNGKELTYKDSNGVSIGFDIPEYTMEEILMNLKLVNPAHLRMVSSGHGEFPDGYKLTEQGVKYIIEQINKK